MSHLKRSGSDPHHIQWPLSASASAAATAAAVAAATHASIARLRRSDPRRSPTSAGSGYGFASPPSTPSRTTLMEEDEDNLEDEHGDAVLTGKGKFKWSGSVHADEQTEQQHVQQQLKRKQAEREHLYEALFGSDGKLLSNFEDFEPAAAVWHVEPSAITRKGARKSRTLPRCSQQQQQQNELTQEQDGLTLTGSGKKKKASILTFGNKRITIGDVGELDGDGSARKENEKQQENDDEHVNDNDNDDDDDDNDDDDDDNDDNDDDDDDNDDSLEDSRNCESLASSNSSENGSEENDSEQICYPVSGVLSSSIDDSEREYEVKCTSVDDNGSFPAKQSVADDHLSNPAISSDAAVVAILIPSEVDCGSEVQAQAAAAAAAATAQTVITIEGEEEKAPGALFTTALVKRGDVIMMESNC